MKITQPKFGKLTNPFILLAVLMLIIVGIDQLLIQFHVYYAANRPLYDNALGLEAAPNNLWRELWFAETIAVVVFPLVLLLLRKKLGIKTRLLPWCVAAIVMFIGIIGTGRVIYDDFKHSDYLHDYPDDITLLVHKGAYYAPIYDDVDPLLQSILPSVFKAQLPVAIGYVGTALGLSIYESKKGRKAQKS